MGSLTEKWNGRGASPERLARAHADERALLRAVGEGRCDAWALSEHHYRVYRAGRRYDFWPRQGTICSKNGVRLDERGWSGLAKLLGIPV